MTPVDVADMLYAVLLAIVMAVGIKYISAIFQAWAQRSNDRQFRLLAERAVASQSETQAALSSMQGDLSRIASSLAAVEALLRQVE